MADLIITLGRMVIRAVGMLACDSSGRWGSPLLPLAALLATVWTVLNT
jgi:hypothetical protein